MNTNVEKLLPNLTGSVVSKILFLEIYFLLRVGKSPAYFTLSDFFDRHSFELLYIGVLFVLLSDWVLFPATYIYLVFAGPLAWCLRTLLSRIKIAHTYIFKELYSMDRKNRTGLDLTINYARANNDQSLLQRATEYKEAYRHKVAAEKTAATNLILVLAIIGISCLAGTPNFLMMVSDFANPYTNGWAYQICIGLFVIQGSIGRAVNFYVFLKANSLPARFFNDDTLRTTIHAWPEEKAGFSAKLEQLIIDRFVK
jgi:hypothetical protein